MANPQASFRTSFVARFQSSMSRISRAGSHSLAAADKRGPPCEGGSASYENVNDDRNRRGSHSPGESKSKSAQQRGSVSEARPLGSDGDGGAAPHPSSNTVQGPSAKLGTNCSIDGPRPEAYLESASTSRLHTSDACIITEAVGSKIARDQYISPQPGTKYFSQYREIGAYQVHGSNLVKSRDPVLAHPVSAKIESTVPENGLDSRLLPRRLEKALRSGIGRLLHSKRGGPMSGEAECLKSIAQGMPTISDASDQRIAAECTVEKMDDMAKVARAPQHLTAQDRSLPGSLKGRPTAANRDWERTHQTTNDCAVTVQEVEAAMTPASAKAHQDVFVTPLSRFHVDYAAGEDMECSNDTSQVTVRRWKSTGEHNRTPRKSPSWSAHSMKQDLPATKWPESLSRPQASMGGESWASG